MGDDPRATAPKTNSETNKSDVMLNDCSNRRTLSVGFNKAQLGGVKEAIKNERADPKATPAMRMTGLGALPPL